MVLYVKDKKHKVRLPDGTYNMLLYVKGVQLFSLDNLPLIDSDGKTIAAKETRQKWLNID